MPRSIDVHVTQDGRSTVVFVKGDVDFHAASELTEAALDVARRADRLVLEMSNVGFIDSAGMGVVVRLRRILKDRGMALHVVPSRRVRAALDLASIMAVVRVHDTLQAALDETIVEADETA